MDDVTVKDKARENYAAAARQVSGQSAPGCCGTTAELASCGDKKTADPCCTAETSSGTCCGTASPCTDPITSNLYTDRETDGLPRQALAASFGCGNPTALAALREAQVVLDLGSGGGIDVLLSARRVGPTGKAYGLDMTDEMLALARENQGQAGVANVEFLKGEVEAIPLPDSSVDVIISNCVVNLSGDKDRVLREAFRVLKPEGRFAVSDVVVRGAVPAPIKHSLELWAGCIAGPLEESEYRTKLFEAGFTAVEVEPTRIYSTSQASGFLEPAGLDPAEIAPQIDGKFMSAFVRAEKPKARVYNGRESRPES